jgi:Tol biopolymer transport system component
MIAFRCRGSTALVLMASFSSFVAPLLGCAGGAASGASGTPSATAYAAFANPTRVAIIGYTGDAMEPFISKDGKYLFFNNRNDATNTDLYYAARIDDQTFTFVGALPGVDGAQLDAVPSLDTLGNFYFISNRSYSTSLSTVYRGHFTSAGVTDVALVPGISRLQAGIVNFDAEISADGQTLWFDDGQFVSGTLRAASIVIADRAGADFVRRADSAMLLAAVNNADLNYAPSISVDGLELFFTRASTGSGATPAIYRATRSDTDSAFETPEWVSGAAGFVEAPSLSADGHLLYFHVLVNGTFVIYDLRR